MLTTERKFNFMTHLKYRHLNVDIPFIGITAVAIPLHDKGKFKGIYTFLECIKWYLKCGTWKGYALGWEELSPVALTVLGQYLLSDASNTSLLSVFMLISQGILVM